MAYKKLKEERYQAFGGINNKISQYLNGPMEFLNLENVDFQVPGSLTKRWGSTQYFGNSLSGKVTGLYDMIINTNFSYYYASAGGTIGICYNDGFSSIFSGSTAGPSFFSSFGSSGIDGYSVLPYNFDFDILLNNVFLANGNNFFKTLGGQSFVFFGLPRFICDSYVGGGFLQDTFHTTSGGTGVVTGFTGFYYYKMAWINSYGMAGAPTICSLNNGAYNIVAKTIGATVIFVSCAGGYSPGVTHLLSLVPPNFDITAVGFFRAGPFGTTFQPGNQVRPWLTPGTTAQVATTIENLDYLYVGSVGVSASSQYATFLDTSLVPGVTFLNINTLPWNWYAYDGSMSASFTTGYGVTNVPNFIETHDNRIFIAGMSYAPSRFFFSEFNEPEHFESDFGFDVRTQDGEAITGLKEYNGNLMIFKTSSFHQLSTAADDFANWVLTPISTEYGCLTNRAVTVYANQCVFLDRKGIIRYNGSNIEILSTKVDPIFQRMNVSAAANNAVMTYDKQRNEILCDIPVDGATMNNLTVVYDIISNSWTTEKGYNATVRSIAQGQLQAQSGRTNFYGGYSGLVSYFGPSFMSDNGNAFTCVIKSGFLTDIGNSTQKVFRRLWLDSTPFGASSAINIRLYQDYGASIIVQTTMYQSPFQSRIDFGVSSKSMSVEFVMGSTYGLALHGFAIAYRFQRNV